MRIAPESDDADPDMLISRSQSGSIVPSASISGSALLVVIAIMSFLAALTVGAVAIVQTAVQDWQNDVAREITVQLKPVVGRDIEKELTKAIAIASSTRGVGGVRALSEEESKALLSPWLGNNVDLADLPVPRLIVVELSDPLGADLEGLGKRLSEEITGAQMDDHRVWAERLQAMAGTTAAGGLAVLALVLAATILIVIFATRGAMTSNRETIAVLHFVGAANDFIAREFQRHFLIQGLKGSSVGGLAAAAVFLSLNLIEPSANTPSGIQERAFLGDIQLRLWGFAGIAFVVIIVAIFTSLTTRLTVRRTLKTID
ncbi:cell division protein FtsX [Coralliovum pocilloporae]|uniref:cell division protein FtsX n=1 Tax=Coralliovum pocilloporae TaxID=3066369 RepID=UPI003307104E